MQRFIKRKSLFILVLLVSIGITLGVVVNSSSKSSKDADTKVEKAVEQSVVESNKTDVKPKEEKEPEKPIENEEKATSEKDDDAQNDEEKVERVKTSTPEASDSKKEEKPPAKTETKINETPVTHKDYQTTTDLNVRTGPSPSYNRIVTIPKGKNVTHVATSGTWYKVKYGNHTGYVSSAYLGEVGTVTTSKPKPSKSKDLAASQTTELTYVQGILIASKNYSLPADYAPGESKEARNAFNKMATDAKKDGIGLVAFSTYRSYATQQSTYAYWVSKDGQAAADRYSAKPGTSEHQTGLAFDIHETGKYDTRFDESDGTRWMANNAHKYGFIVRYPKGKEHITGYTYEPWHLRYLGVDIATKVYNSGLTLEEYLGI